VLLKKFDFMICALSVSKTDRKIKLLAEIFTRNSTKSQEIDIYDDHAEL